MVKEKVGEYMDYASIHGIGRTKNSPFVFLKVLWVLALLASIGVIIFQVTELYMKYKSYPISTSIEVTTAKKLYFPGVTICNTNPTKIYAIPDKSPLLDIVNEGYNNYSIDAGVYKAKDMDEFNYTLSDKLADDKPLDHNILWYIKEQFKMRMSVVNNDDLEKISQPEKDFILLCTFAGTNCTGQKMQIIRSYDYGLCYYFDPLDLEALKPDGKIAAAGPRYALELLLNVEQSDFVPFVTSSPGVAIGIEHPERLITFFDVEDSIFVPTGFEASIGLTQARRKRVPGKSETPRCNDEEYAESLPECKRSCFEHNIFTKCNCLMNFFEYSNVNITSKPLNETFDEDGNAPCYTEQHYLCIQDVLIKNIKDTSEECSQCVPPCSETYFEKEAALSTWPSDNFLPIIRRVLTKQYAHWDGSQEEDFVRNNLALVRIYLKSMTYQTMTEEYSYSPVNFISDIGGQLGLWAGFSILSLLEIIELILILCASAKQNMKKKERNVQPFT